jgi:hypothetical protein
MIRKLLAACCGPLLLTACAWLATPPGNGPNSFNSAEPVSMALAVAPVTR